MSEQQLLLFCCTFDEIFLKMKQLDVHLTNSFTNFKVYISVNGNILNNLTDFPHRNM